MKKILIIAASIAVLVIAIRWWFKLHPIKT
jgi:hypothetical protein